MTLIEAIREKVATGAFEFSQHAVDQSILRHISVGEIVEAIAGGEVIEDYPTDKYGPSCLIMGFTQSRRAVHVRAAILLAPWSRSSQLTNPIQINGSITSNGGVEWRKSS